MNNTQINKQAQALLMSIMEMKQKEQDQFYKTPRDFSEETKQNVPVSDDTEILSELVANLEKLNNSR